MFDLEKASKSQLADIFRAVQEATGAAISAHSTLVRLKPTDLVHKINVACGDKLRVADDGSVVPVEGAEPLGAAVEPTPAKLPNPDQTPTNPVLADFQAWHAAGGDGEFTFAAPVTIGTLRKIAALVGPHPASKPRGGRAAQPDDGVIAVLATENTRRAGSASHARFALLKTGTTVAEYVAAAGPRARRTLRKAIAAGQVRVDPAKEG